MVQNTILPDDPRLTAYALGEMEPTERAEFEVLLQRDAAARKTVAEIRATVDSLTSALAAEAAADATTNVVDFAAAGQSSRRFDGGPVEPKGVLPKAIKFPQFYFMVSGLAAACFAVFFVYWQQHQPLHENKKYLEIPLASAEKAKNEARTNSLDAPEAVPAVSDQLQVAESDAKTVAATSPVVPSELAKVRVAGKNDGAMALAGAAAAPAQAQGRVSGLMATGGSPRRAVPVTEVGGRASPVLSQLKGNTEAYAFRRDNDFVKVADQPLSTFAADVDTASYANVRRFLQQGQRPPVDAVRLEEMVNYFPYAYAGPERTDGRGEAGGPPFAAHLEVASAPWASEHRLVRIGLKGRDVTDAARPAANLVFLLDVSGSMNEPNKLPLVKESLRLLVGKLRADDRVAIAVYAGASGLALPSTPVAHKAEILDAIDRLEAEGSTNGAMGIQLAYDIAKANFVAGGVNRVILATDGDFNVGPSSEGELVRLIQEKAKSGVFLSVLGFGLGNLKDATLEQLADRGNGNYAYIDTLAEARKALVEQAGGTLVTIAKDVKLQVEFNPAAVRAYRLLGYENRLLAKEDFNNDQIDAGELGAGHTVTALYEIVPVGAALEADLPAVDRLKYQPVVNTGLGKENLKPGELLTVKIRYKEPASDVSSKLEFPLVDSGARFEDATPDFKFASAVAAFGLVLRDSPHKGSATLTEIAAWGRAGLGSDVGGYRNEFLSLVGRAESVLQ